MFWSSPIENRTSPSDWPKQACASTGVAEDVLRAGDKKRVLLNLIFQKTRSEHRSRGLDPRNTQKCFRPRQADVGDPGGRPVPGGLSDGSRNSGNRFMLALEAGT